MGLELASSILPVKRVVVICSFITSPQAGAPTMPVPTSSSALSLLPTLRGSRSGQRPGFAVCVYLRLDGFNVPPTLMVDRSMPSLYMSHSGESSRSLATRSLSTLDGVVDFFFGREAADGHAQEL